MRSSNISHGYPGLSCLSLVITDSQNQHDISKREKEESFEALTQQAIIFAFFLPKFAIFLHETQPKSLPSVGIMAIKLTKNESKREKMDEKAIMFLVRDRAKMGWVSVRDAQ